MGRDKAERFLEHLQPLRRKLEGYCRRMVYAPDTVPDVLQEAVAAAYRDFHLYAEGSNFRTWIFAYLHREVQAANRKLRKQRATADLDDLPAPDAGEPPHDLPVHQLLLDAPEFVLERCDADLAGGIRALRPLERAVLLLRAVGEFKYLEVADILQVPVGTVMSALARAREHVRAHLARVGFRDGDRNAGGADRGPPGSRGAP